MTSQEEKSLIIRLCKYGVANKAFKIDDFYSTIAGLTDSDKRFIENILISWGNKADPNHIVSFATNPHPINVTSPPQRQGYLKQYHLRLLPTALFSYIDQLEIIQAREAAMEAKRLSWIAIWISSGIGLISLILAGVQIYLAFKTNS